MDNKYRVGINKNKKNKLNKRQAVRGEIIKKRDIGKITNRLKEFIVFIWKPKFLSAMAALLLVLIVHNKINLDQMLPIQSVKIEGEFDFLDKGKLQDKAIPVVNGGFFNVDLPEVRNALVDLPWVEDVSVRRQWPDKLLVRVIEKKPVVLWGDNGVVSAKGELFEPANKPTVKLPHLSGPQGQHKLMLQELARMQAWLLETGLYIEKIEMNARRSWTLRMTTGMELRLGRKQMHERLNRFVSVYKETLETQKRKIKHIDMRYTNGFSVAWKEA
ncbi:MAG: cell division protein FtsQ [endosymbiont of Galathealinum brachiosum]|uniref:Cell division protein FtsQ n=1 Tax=endosymbiont of Galathealinum brachiosum TaxID=2200906 RepID=A0A370DAK5_9GAMM|nr:MAG: cell division protein FtsQ [endosymbiont of Galathealinum brachiosum]